MEIIEAALRMENNYGTSMSESPWKLRGRKGNSTMGHLLTSFFPQYKVPFLYEENCASTMHISLVAAWYCKIGILQLELLITLVCNNLLHNDPYALMSYHSGSEPIKSCDLF